jgi:molybdenum cofactor cytidylyltransferase
VTPCDCIVPAAGLSRRMGSWKPGLAWRGRCLVEWSVANALAACRRVILVGGYRAEELESIFSRGEGWRRARAERRLLIARNPNFENGLVSSIKVGAALVESERFFVAPADMPRLSPELFEALALALDGRPSGAPAAARPVRGGAPGHPVLFERSVIARIQALPDGESLRFILDEIGLLSIETDDADASFDLDSPADLQEAIHA